MKYQKYVNAMFIAAGVLVWFISQHYTGEAIAYFQLSRKLGASVDFLEHLIPTSLGVISWYLLRFNLKSFNFVSDSVTELIRVDWPAKKDVKLGTIVVLITIVTVGAILGFVDLGFTSVVKFLLGA